MYRQTLESGCRILLLMTMISAVGQSQQARERETSSSVVPELTAILTRMENIQEENRRRARAYVMTREYRLYGSDENQPTSEVVAKIDFVPPSHKSFRIASSQGSGRGKTVVQGLLNGEVSATRKRSPAAVNRQNYDFSLEGEAVVDGSPCWVLQVRPKRQEKSLLKGTVWLDKQTYQLRRMEGDMAQNPSWWVRQVHVAVAFGEMSGMWLQTETRAVADVRLVGRHTLVGKATRIEIPEQVAQQPPNASQQSSSNPGVRSSQAATRALGTGVMVHH